MTGLVGHWPLHEWAGDANDLSGNGNDGTVNGATQGVWGVGGLTAYSFDGSDDYVNIGDKTLFDIDEFTMSCWVRKSGNGNLGGLQAQVNTGNSDAGGWYFVVGSDKFQFFGGQGGSLSNKIKTPSTYSDNNWYHVIMYRRSGGTAKIYVNGDEKVSGTISSANNASDARTVVGAVYHETDGFNNHSTHDQVDFRVYDRILSDSEIQTLYDWGSKDYTDPSLTDGTDSGAVSRYEFTSGSVTTDSWGSNTLTDNTSAGTTTDAIRGDAKSFDGTDDDMDTGFAPSSSTWTASAWINADSLDGNYQMIFGNADGSTSGGIAIQIDSDNEFRVRSRVDGSSDTTSTTDDLVENEWQHVCGTYDGNTVHAYINGVLRDSSDGGYDTGSSNAHIGDFNDGQPFGGLIDEVMYFDRALSDPEVMELYQWGTRGRNLNERMVMK